MTAVTLVIILTALVVPAIDVPASIFDGCLVTAEGAGGCLLNCPQGDGDALSGIGGVITIVVVDDFNNPIVGIPANDFWLIGCGDEIELCGGAYSVGADSATGVQGQTTISGSWAAGACDDGETVQAW